MVDIFSGTDFANSGRLDEWVDSYLGGRPWANEGLRQGLRQQRRYWIGPLRISLDRLERCCGPEPDKEYLVPQGAWERRIADIAPRLSGPPLPVTAGGHPGNLGCEIWSVPLSPPSDRGTITIWRVGRNGHGNR